MGRGALGRRPRDLGERDGGGGPPPLVQRPLVDAGASSFVSASVAVGPLSSAVSVSAPVVPLSSAVSGSVAATDPAGVGVAALAGNASASPATPSASVAAAPPIRARKVLLLMVTSSLHSRGSEPRIERESPDVSEEL